MTYEEAIKIRVSRADARAEIERHDSEGWEAFLCEVGDRDEYTGLEVLNWLGY